MSKLGYEMGNRIKDDPTTTAEVQARHDEHQADIEFTEHQVAGMRNDPDVDFDVSYNGADEAHKDRGYLLEQLEQIKAIGFDTHPSWNCSKEFNDGWRECRKQVEQAILKVKS
jgi:hypothetical protein